MYEKEIQRGIAWLEDERPEVSLDSVNLAILEMDIWQRCILGQLLGGVSCQQIIYQDMDWAERHGFTLLDERETHENWEILTLEWARILRARRAASESGTT